MTNLRTIRASAVICFLIFITSFTYGQKYFQVDRALADSLEKLLLTTEGTERVDLLNRLGMEYAWMEPAKCKALTKEALRLSEELDYRKGLGETYLTEGYRMFLHGESGDLLFKALDIFEELDDKMMVARANEYIASNFFFAGNDIYSTIEYATRALETYEEMKVLDRMAGLYIALSGAVANVAFDPVAAEGWVQKFMEIDSMVDISNIYRGVGYAIMGDIQTDLGYNDLGIRMYRKALKVYDENVVEEKAIKAQQSSALGSNYQRVGNYDSAFYFLDKGLELAYQVTYVRGLCLGYRRMGDFYVETGDLEKALSCYDSSIHYGTIMADYGSLFEKEEYRNLIGWSYEIFRPATVKYKRYSARAHTLGSYYRKIRLYQSLGRPGDELESYRAVLPLKDSAFAFIREKEMEEIQVRYETERKDQQILLLSQQNELNEIRMRQSRNLVIGLAGLLILGILLTILFIRQSRLKAERRTALLEQKLLRSQMNPHFIFNALSTILNLISTNDNEIASRYLIKFSSLLRHILESTRSDLIGLDDEVMNLENYLALQKLRFGDKFDYSIDIGTEIDKEGMMIPPMLIQPFVENSIEHGIKPKKEKGLINIRMDRENGFISCEVLDDGIGRRKAMAIRKKGHKPMATSITRERLDALNRKLDKKVKLEITDVVSDSGSALGTKVSIKIPVTQRV